MQTQGEVNASNIDRQIQNQHIAEMSQGEESSDEYVEVDMDILKKRFNESLLIDEAEKGE